MLTPRSTSGTRGPRRARAVVLTILLAVLTTLTALVGAGTGNPAVARDGAADGPERASFSLSPHAVFGRPGHNGVTRTILHSIQNTPRGATIRAVSWSFSDTDVARALNAADNRGVHVYVLVGGNSRGYAAVKYLRRHLGSGSRIWISNGSARQPRHFPAKGAMHQKSWTFSTTGSTERVSIVTSANATTSATTDQYNDGWVFTEYPDLYDVIHKLFDQQVKFRSWSSPFRHVRVGASTEMWFGPWNRPSMSDPVVKRIRALPVSGLKIRATNAAWSGSRGEDIARALADKKRAGAQVRVVASRPFGDGVRGILRSAGIAIRSPFTSGRIYSHSKFMTAEWNAGGHKKYRVWLGSENWGNGAEPQDELVVMVGNPKAHASYVRFFQRLWKL